MQLAQIVHRKRAIILFEGWEGAGKKSALEASRGGVGPVPLRHAFGQRECAATIATGIGWRDSGRRFRRRAARRFSIAAGIARSSTTARSAAPSAKDWARAYDEINEFEAQQRDHGTLIVKLFFHVSAAVQDERLRERGEDPWRKWLVEPEDLRSRAAREAYLAAWQDMFAHTDTRWAPWHVIDANDSHAARIAALSAIVEALEKAIPLEPPADGDNVVMLAQQKFGQPA